MWSINEEKMQFNVDREFKHDIIKELEMFRILKELFTAKLDKISKLDEKKKTAYTFEQSFTKAAQGSDIISKIQSKIREDFDSSYQADNAKLGQKSIDVISVNSQKDEPNSAKGSARESVADMHNS